MFKKQRKSSRISLLSNIESPSQSWADFLTKNGYKGFMSATNKYLSQGIPKTRRRMFQCYKRIVCDHALGDTRSIVDLIEEIGGVNSTWFLKWEQYFIEQLRDLTADWRKMLSTIDGYHSHMILIMGGTDHYNAFTRQSIASLFSKSGTWSVDRLSLLSSRRPRDGHNEQISLL